MSAITKIQRDPRVQGVSDERFGVNDDGFWVYLKSGWNNGDGGEHAIHEDTPEECLRLLQHIEPCHCCLDCETAASKTNKQRKGTTRNRVTPALAEIRRMNPGAYLPSGAELAAQMAKRK